MSEVFENKLSTPGVFIGFWKALDTVDHIILLKKFILHDLRSNNYDWIKDTTKQKKVYWNRPHNKSQFRTSKLWDSSWINISISVFPFPSQWSQKFFKFSWYNNVCRQFKSLTATEIYFLSFLMETRNLLI